LVAALPLLLLELGVTIDLLDLLLFEGETAPSFVLFLRGVTVLLADLEAGLLLFLKLSERTLLFLEFVADEDLVFDGLPTTDLELPYSLALTYFLGLTVFELLDEDLGET
jgi:hypothetical protein